ncbi:MAG: ParA family protein [Bdellovibrionaceae bacterium]|nr:ParA family protein [Pseudobdellovibrionaceae bacterium]
MNYTIQKTLKMFSTETESPYSADVLLTAIENKRIPNFTKGPSGRKKSWGPNEIPLIGEQFGFIKKPKKPIVICCFVTKGGVLKTSLTLNLARICSLHNIKTCVVGLDMQGDITSALGMNRDLEENDDFDSALDKISAINGLPDLYNNQRELFQLTHTTDLPSLDFIPETPELVNLEKSLTMINRREYWLKNTVTEPLKEKYDLIILDASPNWNLLITNALVACDMLVSPLECKINNFRNFKMFDGFIKEFKNDMNLNFTHLYVPTRWQKQRKLSMEILNWYQDNLKNCSAFSIPESTMGEESSALSLSVPEYAPGQALALSYNQLIREVFTLIQARSLKQSNQTRPLATYKKEMNHGIES